MKRLTEEQVDDLLKLRFGKVVTEPGHTAFVSNPQNPKTPNTWNKIQII